MYIQLFPIYGLCFGFNYWNSDLDFDDDYELETEHLVQLMIGFIGISFHIWKSK
jgi:hypothetical protein